MSKDDSGDGNQESGAEGRRLEDEAPRCEACRSCEAQRDNVSAGGPCWDDIPQLQAPRSLLEFPGLETTDEQHVADLDGVLARYQFDEDVRCSFKGRHPHRTGLVVRMLCGQVLAMGFDCGEKSILGFEAVRTSVRVRERFRTDREAVEKFEERYRRRIAAIQRPLRARLRTREVLQAQLRDLFLLLHGRCHSAEPGTAVKVRRNAGPGEESIEHLVGLDLFIDRPFTSDSLESELQAYVDELRANPPIDGPSARHLRGLAEKVRRHVERAEDWLRDTEGFLSERNLMLALIALGRDSPLVEAVPEGIRVGYMPGARATLETWPPFKTQVR